MKKRKTIKRCVKPVANVEPTLNDNVVFKRDSPYKEGEQPFMFHYVDTRDEDIISECLKNIDDPDKKRNVEDYISRMRSVEPIKNKKITLTVPTDRPRIEKEGMCSTAKAMSTLDYLKQNDMGYDCQTREDFISFITNIGRISDKFYHYAGAKQINVPVEGIDETYYDFSQLDDNSKEICKVIKLLRGKLSCTIDEVFQVDDPRYQYILGKRMFELGREYQKADTVKYKKLSQDGALIQIRWTLGGHGKLEKCKILSDTAIEIRKFIQSEIEKEKYLTRRKTYTWNHKEILERAKDKLRNEYGNKVEDRSMKKIFPKSCFR